MYIAGQVLKKLLLEHPDKVRGQEAVAEQKAQLIYQALEKYPNTYQIIPDKTVRSRMNICFNITGRDGAEAVFLEQSTALGLTGIKGHRSAGGARISNYNAVTPEDVAKLVTFIETFASQ